MSRIIKPEKVSLAQKKAQRNARTMMLTSSPSPVRGKIAVRLLISRVEVSGIVGTASAVKAIRQSA